MNLRAFCIISIALVFVLLCFAACGDSGDDENSNSIDGDTDGDTEKTAIDCNSRRSEATEGSEIDCKAWCNKVAQCAGEPDPVEECVRDCRAKTYEIVTDLLAWIENCILVTSCRLYEQAREQGDRSLNLEGYCRSLALAERPSSLSREEVCDNLYETLQSCSNDTAEINRRSCLNIHAPLLNDEAFLQYARCAEIACDSNNWTECLEAGICHLITD